MSKVKRPPYVLNEVGVIRLPHGVETIVDVDILTWFGDRNWSLGGRRKGESGPRYPMSTGEDGNRVRMHREVMRYHGISIPKGMHVDHINRNALDNRFANLRVVTPLENRKNSEYYGTHMAIYHGVYYMKYGNRKKRWRAQIKVNGEEIALGCYLTEKEGATVYVDAAIRLNEYHRVPEFMKQMREKGEI
jgi:hypothetical protein